jgi:hypothetical protein
MPTPLQTQGLQPGSGAATPLQYQGLLAGVPTNPYSASPNQAPVVNQTPGVSHTTGQTIANIGNSALGQGQIAYNQSQPIIGNVANNLTNNPLQNFLLTGGTNNPALEAYLSAAGVNTQPAQLGQFNQPGQPQAGSPQAGAPTNREAPPTYQTATGGYDNGLGVTVSPDQVNGLTSAQQTQLNGYIAQTTQQQQQAIQSFQSEMEGRFGAGALSPEASAAGQQIITQAYQAQVDQQVATYQTQAQQVREQALGSLLTQGTAQQDATQQQGLQLANQLTNQSEQAQQLAQTGQGIIGGEVTANEQMNQLNLGSVVGALGSLGSGVADLAGAFSSATSETASGVPILGASTAGDIADQGGAYA